MALPNSPLRAQEHLKGYLHNLHLRLCYWAQSPPWFPLGILLQVGAAIGGLNVCVSNEFPGHAKDLNL